jgi:hypothetical protein
MYYIDSMPWFDAKPAFSIQNTFFLENESMQNAGAFPEILTDNDCLMIVKSMYIHVR